MKFQKLMIGALLIGLALAFASIDANAKNTPCSKKKGGIVGCTADGKYLCRNGTVSQSKRRCSR
jgi:hypothetical protein